MPATSPPNVLPANAARVLVWAGVLACIAGFAWHATWSDLPTARAGEAVLLASLGGAFSWLLVRLRGWRRVDALAVFWIGLLALTSGPMATLATATLALAALAFGSCVTGPGRPLLAGVTGAALLAGLVGWLVPVRLHFSWTYLPLLVGLIAWRAASLRTLLASVGAQWRQATADAPRAAAWGVTAIGLASTGTWLPTMQYDDLAYHLGLPWQLLRHGRYALDASQQVWALAPWAGDVLQAIPQVIGGTESRGPVNFLWLTVIAAGAWRLAALFGVSMAFRWASASAVATLPMIATLTAGMQTELPATAVLLVLACSVSDRSAPSPPIVAAGAMLGLLAGLKLLHPATALVLVFFGVWQWRTSLSARPIDGLAAAALVPAVGGSSYAHAWAAVGNPVLPLLNDVFRSPAFPVEPFRDTRWTSDSPLSLPWDLTFDTGRHFEGWSGALGFALVALAGAVIVAIARRETRAVAVSGVFAIAVSMAVLPYARYALPGLALLIPAAVRAIETATGRRTGLAMLTALCVVHVAFAANSNWMLRTGAVKRSLLALGTDEPLLRRYVPERIVASRIRSTHAQARVLDLSGATHAEYAGAGATATWYSPRLHAAALRAGHDPTGRAWSELIVREGFTDVVFRPTSLTPAQSAALVRLRANRVLTVDEVEWRRIPPQDRR